MALLRADSGAVDAMEIRNRKDEPGARDAARSSQRETIAREVRHLRRLLDTQPACLLRVSADGDLLAVNDAGLRLFGVSDRKRLLGQRLARHLGPDAQDALTRFLATVREDAEGSIERHVIAEDGTCFPVVFHGAPVIDPPDGIPSVLLAVENRFQAAATDGGPASDTGTHAGHDSCGCESTTQASLMTEITTERDRLAKTVEAQHAERERLLAEREAEQAQVERALAFAAASREHDRQFVERLRDSCAVLGQHAAAIERRSAMLVDGTADGRDRNDELTALRRDAMRIVRLIEHISGSGV